MSPIPTKRRKLDHVATTITEHMSKREDSDANFSAEESSDEASAALAQPGPAKPAKHPKRKHADNEDALYEGGLYKSSMFKLQVDEMLKEVRPNYQKRMSGVDDALRRLKSALESIEDREALSVPEAVKTLHKSHRIAIPFPDPKPEASAAYKLLYTKPASINVVGSYALRTMVKSEGPLSVDMVVNMPSSIFQEKDYLNYRYFYKRAYYLACIAAGLQETLRDAFSLRYDYLNGNSLHPVLVLKKMAEKTNPQITFNAEIRIILAAPAAFFSESKLRPSKNCVRPKNGSENTTSLPATPFYNASLRVDCNIEPYLKFLHAASKQSDGFKDSCILGRIWLRQRGLESSVSKGGIGHFEWATLTALLLKGGGVRGHSVLSPGYSSYQMFKAVMQFISSTDLAAQPLIYDCPEFMSTKSDVPIVYDGHRGHNILYKMTEWSYRLLRDEAKTSLAMLNEATFDQFESTFILRSDQPLQRYDCLVQVPVQSSSVSMTGCDHKSGTSTFCQRLFATLSEGLSDRVSLIDVQASGSQSWPLKAAGPTASEHQTVLVAVVFDPANIDRLVDHGPSAEEKRKAAKFQRFWGEKAELRRFKDGSILESLVWAPGNRYSVFAEIVKYLMKRHFAAEVVKDITFVGEDFEKALPLSATGTKNFDTLKEAYSKFEREIRALEALPLQLRQLSAVGPQLRYSSINAPMFGPRQTLKEPADVLIQFEGSGRWPDDIVAIQRTKIAFLLKIGALLEEVDGSTTTRLGLENEDLNLRNCAFLDVIYQSGAVFRLRIHNDREQTLLERQMKDKTTDQRSREDAIAALAVYKSYFVQLPLHTQSISTHCTRFPLLSPSIRLMKMWFDRHMLSQHISEELVELMVARTFLQPFPWKAPSSAMTGFLRTLQWLSKWDWRSAPLVVDFTGTMTSQEVAAINTRLEAWRKIDPGMNRTVIFAGSNHDSTGTGFTNNGPSKMIAARMTALARSACKLVKDQGLELDQRSLFAASTTDYDFLIHLNSTFVAESVHKSSHRFKNFEVQSDVNHELVGYQPVRLFVDELERMYNGCIVFFHGTTMIGGLWNPQTSAAKAFKVNVGYATKPAVGQGEDQKSVQIDKTAILSEIARIGGDLVAKIESSQ